MPAPDTGPHRFRMKSWIACSPFEDLLHMTIEEAAEGRSTLSMPFLLEYAQGAGLMHGGALVSLADTAVGMAIKSLLPQGSHFATIALEARFLHPVRQGTVTARARVLGREDRLIRGQATVYDQEGRAVMEFTSTFKIARDTIENVTGITFGE